MRLFDAARMAGDRDGMAAQMDLSQKPYAGMPSLRQHAMEAQELVSTSLNNIEARYRDPAQQLEQDRNAPPDEEPARAQAIFTELRTQAAAHCHHGRLLQAVVLPSGAREDGVTAPELFCNVAGTSTDVSSSQETVIALGDIFGNLARAALEVKVATVAAGSDRLTDAQSPATIKDQQAVKAEQQATKMVQECAEAGLVTCWVDQLWYTCKKTSNPEHAMDGHSFIDRAVWTSMTMTMTPGETAIDSLRECTEEGDQRNYSLAVTGDHCIYLIKPDKGDIVILAGSPSEYGYKDAEKGADARFSSLKGITCIRNCLFVADHWNNAIRCVNLKTRQVDTVVDFQPCGPLALTVSSSGSVYVLDSEYISTCNILKVCSARRSAEASEGALGTAMFQMLQDNIGRSRSSQASSARSSLAEDLSPRAGGARGGSRRGSEAHSQGSGRAASVDLDFPVRDGDRKGERTWNVGLRVCMPHITQDCLRAVETLPEQWLKAAGCIASLRPAPAADPRPAPAGAYAGGERAPSAALAFSMHIPGTDEAPAASARQPCGGGSASWAHSAQLPVVPSALRSLVPGASLHPALVQMTMRSSDKDCRHSMHTALTGSQFHVSVVSTEHQHDTEEGPEFFSFLNPKHESPWKRIPIPKKLKLRPLGSAAPTPHCASASGTRRTAARRYSWVRATASSCWWVARSGRRW
ncbi:unnamed protein product [Prorocentrum cordatum]|uniref:Uncharacterized protein n=1 Tax=Prorocentrum cordatum TaxID=2364126 RepID=A0ABN9VN82_9DINO|nr:unnamed protein product [Polarella glacialis]